MEESLASGAKTINVYCMGEPGKPRCDYTTKLNIADLPRVTWREVSDRLRCPTCGARGCVQIRFNHDENYAGRPACNIVGGQIIAGTNSKPGT